MVEALVKFGHEVSFEQARSQIGKGGDKLIPVFLSADEQREHGKEMEEWRGKRFKTEYLPLVRPFSAVPDLMKRLRDAGLRIAVASSAKKDELEKYLEIARITDLVEVTTSADDAEESKPAPDIFESALKKLGIEGLDAVAIGDTPYCKIAIRAGGARIRTMAGSTRRRAITRASLVVATRLRSTRTARGDATPVQHTPGTSAVVDLCSRRSGANSDSR